MGDPVEGLDELFDALEVLLERARVVDEETAEAICDIADIAVSRVRSIVAGHRPPGVVLPLSPQDHQHDDPSPYAEAG